MACLKTGGSTLCERVMARFAVIVTDKGGRLHKICICCCWGISIVKSASYRYPIGTILETKETDQSKIQYDLSKIPQTTVQCNLGQRPRHFLEDLLLLLVPVCLEGE
jgi:hypothetical protein